MGVNMYSEERTAQMAAYFLSKKGLQMAYIKLLKLLYLADRAALLKWGESLTGDCFVSMPQDSVLSQTYDLIKGASFSSTDGWDYWVRDEKNYEVSLKQENVNRDSFDELSDAELEILDGVLLEFGNMKNFDIVKYTHDHCAEWENPNGSSYPIKPETIFRTLGKNEDVVNGLVHHNNTQHQLDSVINQLR
ncbi:hypothetical protein BMR09_04255 [Methylococcaceae bacterium CS3]|nr:hypothetical protein BMR09_04255 [Methylococcaceae bacterium CS3]